jgi:DNA-directed RNA polymerase subunit N (RpoN/RPB10)
MTPICCPNCGGPLTLREWGTYSDTSLVLEDGTCVLNAVGNDDREGYEVRCQACDKPVNGFVWFDGKIVPAAEPEEIVIGA